MYLIIPRYCGGSPVLKNSPIWSSSQYFITIGRVVSPSRGSKVVPIYNTVVIITNCMTRFVTRHAKWKLDSNHLMAVFRSFCANRHMVWWFITATYNCSTHCSWCVTVASGTLTVDPSNTAVVSGNSATLQCNSTASIHWAYPPGGPDIVYGCVVQPGYTSQYAVGNSTPGQCDLIILNADASLAGAYQCVDSGSPDKGNAYLTVLG